MGLTASHLDTSASPVPSPPLLEITRNRSPISPPPSRRKAIDHSQTNAIAHTEAQSSHKRKRSLEELDKAPRCASQGKRSTPDLSAGEISGLDCPEDDMTPDSSPLSSLPQTLSIASPPSLPTLLAGTSSQIPIVSKSSPLTPFQNSQHSPIVIQSSQSEENAEDMDDDTIFVSNWRPLVMTIKNEPTIKSQPTFKKEPGTENELKRDYTSLSEQDDESDDSLVDLATLLSKRAQKKAKTMESSPHATISRSRRETAYNGTYDIPRIMESLINNDCYRPPPRHNYPQMTLPVKKTYKNSLLKLNRQHNKQLKDTEEVRKAEEALAAPDPQSEDEAAKDADLFDAMMQNEDGEEKVGKLKDAMGRTEVFNTRMAWHFFDSEDDILNDTIEPFPRTAGLEEISELFNDTQQRDYALITGFASNLFASGPLSAEILQWLWRAAFNESRSDIREGYIGALMCCGENEDVYDFLDASYVRRLFQALRPKPASIYMSEKVASFPQPVSAPILRRPRRLLQALDMLARLPHVLTLSATTYAIGVLTRLAADTTVVKHDVEVQIALQQAFAALIESLPDESEGDDSLLAVLFAIQEHVQDHTIQLGLLSSLPYTTPRLALFRRRLALSFFLCDPMILLANPNQLPFSATIPKAILDLIKTSRSFRVSEKSTDYHRLTSLISILDIGIGPGFSSSPQVLALPTIKTPIITDANPQDAPQISRSHFNRPQLRKTSTDDLVIILRKEHNTVVDTLARIVNELLSRIDDRGAAHMSRTEAKGVLERLHNRLAYGVRYGSKYNSASSAWIDSGMNMGTRIDRFLKIRPVQTGVKQFLTSKKVQDTEEVRRAVVDGDGVMSETEDELERAELA